ncbi:hypothetical protein BASA83_010345 [Batrachochytrium salamandrivorans]|nr:hypothetical protein BASA83_010345 [Batrachochytrium salamandrivorans]
MYQEEVVANRGGGAARQNKRPYGNGSRPSGVPRENGSQPSGVPGGNGGQQEKKPEGNGGQQDKKPEGNGQDETVECEEESETSPGSSTPGTPAPGSESPASKEPEVIPECEDEGTSLEDPAGINTGLPKGDDYNSELAKVYGQLEQMISDLSGSHGY